MSPLQQDDHLMTEEEFKRELKGSLLILTTSSPDKRDIYRLFFSSHAKGEDHHAGLDLYYHDSGALGLAPRKTPEQTGEYSGNLDEKAVQQLIQLQSKEVSENIRLKLMASGQNHFNAQKINIMGMTEDSGWELTFESREIEKKFIDKITEKIKPLIREKDSWLIDNLHKNGFPGPNLKPLQEHLGGFNALMELIYDTASDLDIKELRFSNSTNVSFVSPRIDKVFQKTFKSVGRVLTRNEYHDRLLGASSENGEAINSNFVHVPDGQASVPPKTIDVLIREGLHSRSSQELPASYARRELTEYLQGLIGKRRSSSAERKRPVRVAYVHPGSLHGEKPSSLNIPNINDLLITSVPAESKQLAHPHEKAFDDADVIVLIPENAKNGDNHLRADPTLAMLLSFVVTAETDPESMGIPIVLDNRSGGFKKALELISDAFAQGRLMGDTPFYVANTDEELKHYLTLLKDVKQRAPVIKTIAAAEDGITKKLPDKVPNDGVFTVFIGGGHANNSKRDLEDAQAFGYYCAQHGWRIITGAGSVEGSMGATHTGFVQFHLDQLQTKEGNDAVKTVLAKYIDAKTGKYDAEKIILEKPDMIEELAVEKLIPRDMFFGYSMAPLLEMESPSGEHPPGITYFEAGNRVRRLAGLLASGTKVFLPGSIGTDEEFDETVKQHLAARLRKQQGIANDDAFSDGTPDEDGTIIVYNRKGHLDKLLKHYGLSGSDPVAAAKRERNNIIVITELEELKQVSSERAESWLERVSGPADATEKIAAVRQ